MQTEGCLLGSQSVSGPLANVAPATLRRVSAVIADLVAFRFDGQASSTQTPKAGVDVAVAVGATLKLRHTFVQDVQYESDPPEQGIRYWPSGHGPVEQARHAAPKRNVFGLVQKFFLL